MYKRILVPLDGSALAEAALVHAQQLANQPGVGRLELRLITVISLAPNLWKHEEQRQHGNPME